MTIDIRARVYCSLGEIVQGSLSDTYVQGNGLVFCRGSVTLAGIYQPTLGQVVDFAYEKNGYLSRLPRRLRVLSSFADPFARQTTIQLGCKLTMLEDLAPNNAKIVTTGIQAVASSSSAVVQYSGQSSVLTADTATIPDNMRASVIASDILSKINIATATAIPLQSRFSREQIDLSQGYVKALADLLLSENYLGFLNESEQLVIRSIDGDGGSGPVLRRDDIISLDAVNSGELPAENVKVEYSTYQIRKKTVDPTNRSRPNPPNPEPPDLPNRQRSTWAYEESVGNPVNTVTIYNYTTIDGTQQKRQLTTTSIPYVQTWTYFNNDGSTRQRVTRTRTTAHQANSRYFGDALSNGFTPAIAPSAELASVTTEDYEYDSVTGDQVQTTRRTVETAFAASGRLSLPYVVTTAGGGKSLITPGQSLDNVTTELTINTMERVRYNEGAIVEFSDRGSNGRPVAATKLVFTGMTKTRNVVYRNYGATQEGQQAAAWNADNATTLSEVTAAFNSALYNLVTDTSEVRIVNDPNAYSEKLPPGAQEVKSRAIKANPLDPKEKPSPIGQDVGPVSDTDGNVATAATWLYSSGAASVRTQTFRVPYTGDDWFQVVDYPGNYYYAAVSSNRKTQALAFGRIQNRMLLGHRNGLSLQVAPELMPPRPFDPVYIDLDGLAGQYRVNGLSWAFDANGLACSIDAMFWGGVGTTS